MRFSSVKLKFGSHPINGVFLCVCVLEKEKGKEKVVIQNDSCRDGKYVLEEGESGTESQGLASCRRLMIKSQDFYR